MDQDQELVVSGSDSGGDDNVEIDFEEQKVNYDESQSGTSWESDLKLSAEQVAELNKNWTDLEAKYGWTTAGGCTKLSHKLCNFFTGFLVVVFLTLPAFLILLILILLCAIVYLLTCCNICGNNEHCDSFPDFVRLFMGKQRLWLLTIPTAKQGLLWKSWNAIIGLFQFIDLVKHDVTSGVGDLYDFIMKYRGIFGKTFPYLESVAVSDYDYSLHEINSNDSIRDGATAGFIQSSDIPKYLFTLVLNTSDIRHKVAKDIANMLCQFDLNVVKDLEYPWKTGHFLHEYSKTLEDFEKNHFNIVAGSIVYYLFNGAEPNKQEMNDIVNGSMSGYLLMPNFVHFLLGNNITLVSLYEKMAIGRKFLRKYGNHNGCGKLDKLLEYAKKHGLREELVLNSAVCSIFFTGLGDSEAKKHATQRFLKDMEGEYSMYNKNKAGYILEITRQHSPLTMIVNRAKNPLQSTILGKKYTFPVNCNIATNLAFVDECPAKFGKNGKTFDPFRKDFGCMMAFNALEEYYNDGNGEVYNINKSSSSQTDWNKLKKKAPRFCPGHDIQFYVMMSFIECLYKCVSKLERQQERGDWTIKSKIIQLLCPIKILNHTISPRNVETVIFIRPESFRIIFFIGFVVLLMLGQLISTYLSDVFKKTDNPIVERFGLANICIYFDDVPFTYFGPFLWIFLLINVICYELSDFFRIYDAFKDGAISFRFYKIYRFFTIYEIVASMVFVQCFAVTPNESKWEQYGYDWVVKEGKSMPGDLYWHTIPFEVLIYAFWTMVAKKYAYYVIAKRGENGERDHSHVRKDPFPWYYKIAGGIYLIVFAVTTILYSLYIWLNLFGMYTWKIDGMNWTRHAAGHVQTLFAICTFGCPIIIFYITEKNLRIITIVINRTENGLNVTVQTEVEAAMDIAIGHDVIVTDIVDTDTTAKTQHVE